MRGAKRPLFKKTPENTEKRGYPVRVRPSLNMRDEMRVSPTNKFLHFASFVRLKREIEVRYYFYSRESVPNNGHFISGFLTEERTAIWRGTTFHCDGEIG